MDTPKLAQKPTTITFIGAGNMARSLIVGLLQDQANVVLRVADPDEHQLDAIRKHWPEVTTTTDNLKAMQGADLVVLAVKPQIMRNVTENLASHAQLSRPLFVSIAAGIREEALNRWLGGNQAIVRCMPNTPLWCKPVQRVCMRISTYLTRNAVQPKACYVLLALQSGSMMKPSWMPSPPFLAAGPPTSFWSWKPCKPPLNSSVYAPKKRTC
ncbi:pyrroline-5-carboxylate reductase family protein [Thiothrix subterranea]|uniref:pyrroline-5-carboxylate reductase family protein n=1 Tax=Thiothrix subterranea TaxID=2735563 RepID=UPI00280A8437|nr:NAD(P)-binding domain-containing protein [Thiothrix subterranea]